MFIIYSILILSFLVIIHELGHYLAARWAGVKVEEFGLGYPPRAKKLFEKWGTEWTLNWIPFGGFVKLWGEEDEAEDAKKFTGKFSQLSVVKKLVTILAGASVNFVFGVLAFAVIYSIVGIPHYPARFVEVAPGSPAAQAGLTAGNEVTRVESGDDSMQITSADELMYFISEHAGSDVTLTTRECQDDGVCTQTTETTAYIRTAEETPEGEGALGVAFDPPIMQTYPWYEMPVRGAVYGTQQALGMSVLILDALGSLVQQAVSNQTLPADLAGPVGIVQQAGELGVFQDGFLAALSFAGMLSINLAIMNVLPIVPLDGGRAVFIILERIIGAHRSKRIEEVAGSVGYIVLMGLIIIITARDITRLW
ncbi:MAG: site-2 protease family protein [Pseudomonadales bacterium]|nr:site-2 protease family protein [Candidatus Woesebacteria bacterium]MCB9802236.1 site-2 protease family protein [Pseudomonadales bacterium]